MKANRRAVHGAVASHAKVWSHRVHLLSASRRRSVRRQPDPVDLGRPAHPIGAVGACPWRCAGSFSSFRWAVDQSLIPTRTLDSRSSADLIDERPHGNRLACGPFVLQQKFWFGSAAGDVLGSAILVKRLRF